MSDMESQILDRLGKSDRFQSTYELAAAFRLHHTVMESTLREMERKYLIRSLTNARAGFSTVYWDLILGEALDKQQPKQPAHGNGDE